MSSTTNLLSTVIKTSNLPETVDQVRPCEDPLDGYPQVNVVESAGRQSQASRELIAVVSDYVRRSKERPIHLLHLENAQDKLMVAAGVSPKKRIAEQQKSTAAKKTRQTHKVSERMVAGQTVNTEPRKKAAAPAVDVSEFTGLKDRDRLPGHEYPCTCDLSLPRKSLTEAERNQKGIEYLKQHLSSPGRKISSRNVDTAKLGVQNFTETGDSQSVDGSALAIETSTTQRASREPTTRRQPTPPDSPAQNKTGRPPMRSPPRLKLTVAQSPRINSTAPNKKAAGKGFDKVRMNRAAFLRFEHTKYCGRGLTLSLMGGARLREEELALLKAKKEKTNKLLKGRKGGKNKGPKRLSKRELKKMKEEAERQKVLAERKDEEMRMSRLNTVMDGRTCSYFECWIDQSHGHHAKGRKRGDVVRVHSVTRKLPPRKAKK